MSGPGYSLPTGVPLQVTEKRGPPQLGLPQVEQSLPFGVQPALGDSEGLFSVGQLAVHAAHEPLWQVVSPVQVPQRAPQPSEPQLLPVQLGVQAG